MNLSTRSMSLLVAVALNLLGFLSPLPAEPVTIRVFHSTDCPHCVEALAFLRDLRDACPDIEIVTHEVHQEREYWLRFTEEHQLPRGVYPLSVIGKRGFVGFLEGEGPLEQDPSGKGYLGYSSQILAAVESAGSQCDLGAFVASREEGGPGTQNEAEIDGDSKSPVRPFLILLAIPLYASTFFVLRRRSAANQVQVWWTAGLLTVTLVSVGVLLWRLPPAHIRGYAEALPFFWFVAIIALADGFNPCAFTVLVILLSLLTHLRRRDAMIILATTFVATSAVMYALFILAFTALGGVALAALGSVIIRVLGVLVLVAGGINLWESLSRSSPVSLSLSDRQKSSLSRRGGHLVQRLQAALDKPNGTRRGAFLAGMGGTVVLASAANLAELGCTAVLPMVYIARLYGRYGLVIAAPHVVWTGLYAAVYVLPLAVVAVGSTILLHRGRMSAAAGRGLKGCAGLLMVVFGLSMVLRPEWIGL